MERANRKFILDDATEYATVGVRWYGLGAFIRNRQLGLSITRKQQWTIRAGDVVYNKLFAWKGAFAIAGDDVDGCIVSDKFPTYVLDHDSVDPRFLAWYFRTHYQARQAASLSKGAAAISKLTLNPPAFWDLTIPLPPLSEQRRIVERVDGLAIRIDEAQSLNRSAMVESESLLLAFLESILVEQSERYTTEKLSRLVEPERGISYGVVLTGEHVQDGIPTLRAGGLRKFEVVLEDVKRIDPSIEEKYQRTRLRGNELLLKIRGGFGEVAVCPHEMKGGNVSREIAVIPISEQISPFYAMYMLAAPSSQNTMAARVRGTSYVGINLKDVRNLAIPVPPLEKQREVVSRIDRFRQHQHEVLLHQVGIKDQLDEMLPSVLNRAFNGEL